MNMGAAPQPAPVLDVEHLKVIQAIVNRLAQNSFQTKSWSVTVVTGILAFASRSGQAASCALALFPAFCFWVLDAYYLRQERLFRALYKAAVAGEVSPFSMDIAPYQDQVAPLEMTMIATPVALVHGIIFVVVGIVIVVFALS
jgi:hypothetical protein